MKSYLQGLITGGVMVFAILVLMGASNIHNKIGRYQLSSAAFGRKSPEPLLLDTTNGLMYRFDKFSKSWSEAGEPME